MSGRFRSIACLHLWVFYLACVGCVSMRSPLLNSERIERTFGSYGIEVLYQSPSLRVSNLYSGTGESRTTRTVALVAYPDEVAPALVSEHEAILGGSSIGSTFAAAGWRVVKENRYFGERRASEKAQTLMQLAAANTLAVHIYEFVVERNGDRWPYAVILEMHHPEYLKASEVQEIFADSADRLDSAAATRLFQQLATQAL